MSDPGSDFHGGCPLSWLASLTKEFLRTLVPAIIFKLKRRDLTIVRSLSQLLISFCRLLARPVIFQALSSHLLRRAPPVRSSLRDSSSVIQPPSIFPGHSGLSHLPDPRMS